MENSDFQCNEHAMNRHRRRIAHARNETERMEISERLQVSAMKAICSDPVANHAFMIRNHSRRRNSEVQRLLQQLTLEKQ